MSTYENGGRIHELSDFVFCVFEVKGDVYYEFIALFLAISFVETIRKQYTWGVNNRKIGESNG